MTKYRVLINMIENGFVDVEAQDEQEATDKATEESNNGGFVGSNSYAEIVGVEKNE